MTHGDCVHLYNNALAAITHRRTAPLTDIDVDSLLYTTLCPTAPLVLINFEVDDCGLIEKPVAIVSFPALDLAGAFATFSFGKIDRARIKTLMGTDLLRLLEHALPARLGGRPGKFDCSDMMAPLKPRWNCELVPECVDRPPRRFVNVSWMRSV